MVSTSRIPFHEAISESLLLKDWFYGDGSRQNPGLSLPQQVALKCFYGLDLSAEELKIWSLFQEGATYDPLGYPIHIDPKPYTPKEYHQLTCVFGRRSGKTASILATIMAYEVLLGGHEDFVGSKQQCVSYMIAHRADVAELNMPFIEAVVESSPMMRKEIVSAGIKAFRFKNNISIIPSPPSIKAQRGLAVPVVIGDESGFWYTDTESANPDFEVERAVEYSQMQFPNAKMIWASTPWTREGVLWKYYSAGTEGCKLPPEAEREEFEGCLSLHAPTAAMQNPRMTREALERRRRRDPRAFERESLARFVDSVSGFLTAESLQKTVQSGVARRVKTEKATKRFNYVAAIDPAFRHDSFAFTIVHKDPELGIVQDVVRRFTPLPGERLNPKAVLEDIIVDLREYGIQILYSDQYQLESLQQLALQYEISIIGRDFTGRSKAQIFGNLQKLVDQGRIHLLDPLTSEAAAAQFHELRILEKKLGGSGSIQISAPTGRHDDMACALALAVSQAMQLEPETVHEVKKDKTIVDKVLEQIKRRRMRNYGYSE